MSFDTIKNLMARKAELDKVIDGIYRYLHHAGARDQHVGDCTGVYWQGFIMPAPYVRKCADELLEQYTAERTRVIEALATLEKVAKGLVSASQP
jgi:hypothetical protein